MVLDVTAKTQDGTKVFGYQRIWQEVGTDLAGNQQVRAWDIKNTIDLALQPRQVHTERLPIQMPEGTTSAEIEATITYHHRPGEEFVVHKAQRKIAFRK